MTTTNVRTTRKLGLTVVEWLGTGEWPAKAADQFSEVLAALGCARMYAITPTRIYIRVDRDCLKNLPAEEQEATLVSLREVIGKTADSIAKRT